MHNYYVKYIAPYSDNDDIKWQRLVWSGLQVNPISTGDLLIGNDVVCDVQTHWKQLLLLDSNWIMSRLEFTHLKGVELILTLPYPVSYYINCLYDKWKSIKKCFKSAANLQSLFKGIVLACVQSGQKPGSFPQEMRFKFQQFMRNLQIYGWNIPYIYHLMNLKLPLITTYSYHIQSFHTLVQTILSHTGCIFSQLLARAGVWVCKFFPWERRVFLGSCGVPAGPTPNLTWPDSSPKSWWWHTQKSSL